MRPVGVLTVEPSLPPRLEALRVLATNLRWSWNAATRELFRRLDSDLWEETGHNPVELLGRVASERLLAMTEDDGFLSHMDGVTRGLEEYVEGRGSWFQRTHGPVGAPVVAYFSAEFGLTECLPIFAGGLGILAGDHLKSASDLGVPLVGVGLLYQEGYHRQYLNDAGWQNEQYVETDFHRLPLERVTDAAGEPLRVQLALPGRTLHVQLWRASVGRVALVLLDTNLEENSDADRDITDRLYGGDVELRLQQELVLGIGGVRALAAMGYAPQVFHMNEGHSAFLGLERIRQLRELHQLSFTEAHELARAGLIFTTHTPVDAGHDRFPPELLRRYFTDYAAELGPGIERLLELGRARGGAEHEPFNMSLLALRLASRANGVSRLHAQVSRKMFHYLWGGLGEGEVPIGAVSNGVHFRSWISRELDQLLDRYLGRAWSETPGDTALWRRAHGIPAEELWRTHERRRERLIAFVRRRLRQQLQRRRAAPSEIELASEALDPDVLTIGFARRFAPYKRATLLLRDRERLAALLQDPERRVQFIFAGKAHPRDDLGKELIREIAELSRQEPFRGRVVFVEDYDLAVARYMVQGCDVWLNTPRRPLEASGTSGMKAAANAVLNVSTLDGWWADAWERLGQDALTPGWAIGSGEEYADTEVGDQVEAVALYDLLERAVIPEFYDRGRDGLPRRWVQRMQLTLAELCPYFDTHRMVREYVDSYYLPALRQTEKFAAAAAEGAKALAHWREHVQHAWNGARIDHIEQLSSAHLRSGEPLAVRARVLLDGLGPADVLVELCLGRVNASGELAEVICTEMAHRSSSGNGDHAYEAAVPVEMSGRLGYTVRLLPRHPALVPPVLEGMVRWADGGGPRRP